MSTETTTTRFQQTPSTALLIALLTRIAEAEDYRVLSYPELSEVAHRNDLQGKGRHHLQRARLRVLRDRGKWFRTEAGIGLKLATDAEASDELRRSRDHIRSTARNGRERATAAHLEKLSNSERLKHFANDALLALTEQAAKPISAKRIEAEIEKTGPKSFEAQELIRVSGLRQLE